MTLFNDFFTPEDPILPLQLQPAPIDNKNPEGIVANLLAIYLGKTFSQSVSPENFRAISAHIVKEIAPLIITQAAEDLRELMKTEAASIIPDLYQEAGDGLGISRNGKPIVGLAADLLAKIWTKVNDGTMEPTNWIEAREKGWTDR